MEVEVPVLEESLPVESPVPLLSVFPVELVSLLPLEPLSVPVVVPVLPPVEVPPLVPVVPPVVEPVVPEAVLVEVPVEVLSEPVLVLVFAEAWLLLEAALVSDSVVFSVAFSVVFWVAFSVSDSDSVETRVVVSDWPTWIFSLCLRQPLKLKAAAIITARTSAPHFFLFRIVSCLHVNRFQVTTAIIEDLGENCNFVTGKKS